MLMEPKCFNRQCSNFLGVIEVVNERDQKVICKAFLGGIPLSIAYGDDLHLKPIIGQDNNIVYEKEK
uniref:Uncharacterized protein n=1 Tax=viral metagenome TaxID=1070528 RepID=A0A6M3LGD2_9ZZZZ